MDKVTQDEDDVFFEKNMKKLNQIKEIMEKEVHRRFQVFAQEEEKQKKFLSHIRNLLNEISE